MPTKKKTSSEVKKIQVVFTVKVINSEGFEDTVQTSDKIKADKHLFDALFLDEVEVTYKKEIINPNIPLRLL